jgi:hypothetical protein
MWYAYAHRVGNTLFLSIFDPFGSATRRFSRVSRRAGRYGILTILGAGLGLAFCVR